MSPMLHVTSVTDDNTGERTVQGYSGSSRRVGVRDHAYTSGVRRGSGGDAIESNARASRTTRSSPSTMPTRPADRPARQGRGSGLGGPRTEVHVTRRDSYRSRYLPDRRWLGRDLPDLTLPMGNGGTEVPMIVACRRRCRRHVARRHGARDQCSPDDLRGSWGDCDCPALAEGGSNRAPTARPVMTMGLTAVLGSLHQL